MDIALVIPLDAGRVHLVEQYRRPVGARSWELPSGDVDPHDAGPAAAAARELREETGLTASSLTPLGVLDVHPSTLADRCHVFLATGLAPGPPDRDVGEQDMRSASFARAELHRMVHDGMLTDAKSLAAYALLLVHEDGVQAR
ncbi:MAG TPA: NUDIX hydrolase [Nocardioides sp.]|nr:NUDIX hydrolase [Nocardioides sp.]